MFHSHRFRTPSGCVKYPFKARLHQDKSLVWKFGVLNLNFNCCSLFLHSVRISKKVKCVTKRKQCSLVLLTQTHTAGRTPFLSLPQGLPAHSAQSKTSYYYLESRSHKHDIHLKNTAVKYMSRYCIYILFHYILVCVTGRNYALQSVTEWGSTIKSF